MNLFKKKKKEQLTEHVVDQKAIKSQVLKLEIHTMPKKFLGVKPKASSKIGGKDATAGPGLGKPKEHSLKKNIIIGGILIVVLGSGMALAAYFFVIRDTGPVSEANNQPSSSTKREATTTAPSPPAAQIPEPKVIKLINPTRLTFTGIKRDSAVLSWRTSPDDRQGFKIYQNSENNRSSADLVNTVSADIKSFTLSGLDCGTRYYYWVEAYSASDLAVSQAEQFTTLECPPPPAPLATTFIDADRDLLTEAEEKIFATDPDKADSDQDGFLDGQEVLNLFDPRFAQGATLVDSNSIRTFISNEFNYRLFIPTSWSEKIVEADKIRFEADNNVFFEVIVEKNLDNFSSARDWYVDQFPSIPESSLTNVQGQNISGIVSPDGLTSYFITPDYIYTLTYNPGLKQELNYLTTYRMMVRSFSLFADPF